MESLLKVAVLTGGISSEDYLSRRSGELILEHANSERYVCSLLNWDLAGWVDEYAPGDPTTIIQRHESILAAFVLPGRFDIVLNALHGELECEGQLQGLLELAKQPYTGNGRRSSMIGMNKILSKKIFREAGFLTADWICFNHVDGLGNTAKIRHENADFHYPVVVKAATGGSSNSLLLANNGDEMHAAINRLLADYDEVYIEPFLEGLEYTVAVFGAPDGEPLIALPVAHIRYEGEFFDAVIKKDNQYEVVIPCGLPEEVQEQLKNIAKSVHQLFHFHAFSRVDFRFSEGKPYLLEVNTHPGFGESSIVPHMFKAAGISWETAIEWIIEGGLRRKMR